MSLLHIYSLNSLRNICLLFLTISLHCSPTFVARLSCPYLIYCFHHANICFESLTGQVVNVLREEQMSAVNAHRLQQTPCITIPTHFQSGITLFVRAGTPAHEELQMTDVDLPRAIEVQSSSLNFSHSAKKGLKRKVCARAETLIL